MILQWLINGIMHLSKCIDIISSVVMKVPYYCKILIIGKTLQGAEELIYRNAIFLLKFSIILKLL